MKSIVVAFVVLVGVLLCAQSFQKPKITVSGPYSVAGSGVSLDTGTYEVGQYAFCELTYAGSLGSPDTNPSHVRTEFIANRFELLDNEVFRNSSGYLHQYCRLSIPRDVRGGVYKVRLIDDENGIRRDMGTHGISAYEK